MSRVLITGGSGFIGTNLVQYCLDQKLEQEGRRTEVLSLDVQPPSLTEHRANWRPVDIRDRAATVAAFVAFRPDFVFHLAARADLEGGTVADYDANTVGVENAVLAVKASGAERALFVSSQLVCTPGYQPKTDEDYCPPNPYGESKVIGEQIVRTTAGDDFCWALLRPTSIWGPWFNRPYNEFFQRVRTGRYVEARGRRVRKSFGYIGNTVFQFGRLAARPPAEIHKRVLYMADYEPVVVSEWSDMIRRGWGAPPVRQVPVGLLQAAAAVGDLAQKLGMKAPPMTSYRLRNLLTDTPQDMGPLRAVCGALPYTQQEGTDLTIQWMKEHPGG